MHADALLKIIRLRCGGVTLLQAVAGSGDGTDIVPAMRHLNVSRETEVRHSGGEYGGYALSHSDASPSPVGGVATSH